MEVLVLPLHGLQLVQRLLIGVLQLEHLCAESASLFLSSFQLCLALLVLLLPFCQDLHRSSSKGWNVSFTFYNTSRTCTAFYNETREQNLSKRANVNYAYIFHLSNPFVLFCLCSAYLSFALPTLQRGADVCKLMVSIGATI